MDILTIALALIMMILCWFGGYAVGMGKANDEWLQRRLKGDYEIIRQIPSADVRENIHGTWEHWKGEKFFDVPVCSNCGMTFSINAGDWSFCPNCGCQMDGKEKAYE